MQDAARLQLQPRRASVFPPACASASAAAGEIRRRRRYEPAEEDLR